MGPRLIAGRYELVEQLGRSTWRATDTELQRDVVVQIPALDTGLARLTHPGIAHLFDQGEEDGERYAVLEFLPGGTLEQRLDAASLSEAESRRIAADVTAALAYAHEHGVTHGALGPGSILFSSEGEAKVAGFTGEGSAEEDERALGAILQSLAAAVGGATDVTAILRPEPVAVGRRPVALIVAVAVALLAGGVGAALLATGDDSDSGGGTGSVQLTDSTASTQDTGVAPPTTTPEETEPETTTAPTATDPAETTAPPETTEPPPTTAPTTGPTTAPPTTEPLPTTEPAPTTTEPAATEPPPATTNAGETETTG